MTRPAHIPVLPEGHHPLSPVALRHTVKHSALQRPDAPLLRFYAALLAVAVMTVLGALLWHRFAP